MIKSMTGFGRAELKTARGSIRAEIKTVNHKFLEISCRLPHPLPELEEALRKLVCRDLRRGKVHVSIQCPDPLSVSARLLLNEDLARQVHQKIKRLKAVLGLSRRQQSAEADLLELREVLRYPDVLMKDTAFSERSPLVRDIERAVSAALKNLSASRRQEGALLDRDLRGRVREIDRSVAAVEKLIPGVIRDFKTALASKIKDLVKDGTVDHDRITLEAALFAKNTDISEEVTRLKAHCQALRKTLGESGEIGRKIDFIAQEMSREANTMGAKSPGAAISEEVIRIKGSIEKIREQAQNVE